MLVVDTARGEGGALCSPAAVSHLDPSSCPPSTRSLPLLIQQISSARVGDLVTPLSQNLLTGNERQRDIASIGDSISLHPFIFLNLLSVAW